MKQVLENIRNARLNKRLSQAEMAEKMGIAINNYSKLERGVTELNVSRLFEIADLLETNVVQLLGNDVMSKDNDENNIVYQSKIEELEKRVNELQSWLDDKTKLSRLYKKEYDDLSKNISIALDLIIKEYALRFEMGEFRYMVSKGVIKNLTAKEFKEHTEGNVVRTYADFNALIITEAQLIELFDLIFYSDLEKGNVLSHLIESVTESESFLENRYVQAYKKRRGF